MLLTLDIGNSHTVLGFFDSPSAKLLHHFRIKTDHNTTGDEYGLMVQGLLELKGRSLADINHAIMIRSFLSRDHTLYYQAGAGIVSESTSTPRKHAIFSIDWTRLSRT